MSTWEPAIIARFLVRGRSGATIAEMAAEFGVDEDTAESLWTRFSSEIDRYRRAKAIALFSAGPPDPSQHRHLGFMTSDDVHRLLEAGRSGRGFPEIGKELRIGKEAARKRWQKYAGEDDKEIRAAAVRARNASKPRLVTARLDTPSAAKNDTTPLAYEPPVGKPLREFPACTFTDDPRAERNIGTPTRMSAPETRTLGGSSLAGVIGGSSES